MSRDTGGPGRVGPGVAVLLVLVGITSVQFGAAVAKDLFARVEPTMLVWLRLASSALLLVAMSRPRLPGRTWPDWRAVLWLGLCLGVMNWSIYQAFARIPLGIAVTIEFVGPLTLAAVGSRRARDLLWVALAAVGVALLGFGPGAVTAAGVGYAVLAGAAWAGYILATADTGRRWEGLDGLAVASAVASLGLLPFALRTGPEALGQTDVVVLGAVIGLMSSVIPYSCEMAALRVLPPPVFSILMSLEPVAAALAAMVIVGEFLSPVHWVAMGCVLVATLGATRSGSTWTGPAPD